MTPRLSPPIRRAFGFGVFLLASMALGSCGNKNQAASDTPPVSATSTTPVADTAWTDAGIAAMVIAANTADIENAQMAQTISKTPSVTTFASQMASDHTLLNAKVNELAGKLSLVPKDNDMSRALTAQANAQRDSLKTLTGAAFDKAYIGAEVTIHQNAIDLLDTTLLPRAQNPDLRTLIESARPIFQSHLSHATAVQASLH